jgi:hypothetical protein
MDDLVRLLIVGSVLLLLFMSMISICMGVIGLESLITNLNQYVLLIIGYYLGSSSGSSRKTELLGGKNE